MDHFYARSPRLEAAATPARLRVACIGGGPASLACAAELRRHGVAVTIYDARPLAGGLNTYGIAEYKLRPQDSLLEVELVRSMGARIECNVEVGVHVTIEQLERDYDALFIGVGLGPTEALGLPGEDLEGVVDALRFIREYKTGTPRAGRRVIVVGAGNTAIDAATAAVRLGAEEVSIVYRRSEPEMPAFRYELELARQDGIRFHWLSRPVAIHGTTRVESLECTRVELGEPDATGRRAPKAIPGPTFHLPCDMVITAIGQSRLLQFLERCRGVALDRGRVIADRETGRTANPRYFAGGDCVNGGREVVDAVAEGKRAALGMILRL